ncbi:MAG: family 1 glycosylhydrolase [Acidisphaera sp.]|nr:family 1 glycosylhydrolase [Acidisphaera sp.]
MVRVGDTWRDQLRETGHYDRPEDLDTIAALGLRTLRYPVLWEHVAPRHPAERDWHWHDDRLQRLLSLGVAPIAGLVHHGSGPRYTSLADPGFGEGLARHAAAVARRYPWIADWTPVNEPLTTARFSGLYGHWYPHQRDPYLFLRMVANQCHATLLAMRAIRREVPHARLVQTEDIGKTFATSRLAYQAEHDNARRWLSFDLLCGHLDRNHPWWNNLLEAGVPQRQLEDLLSGEAAPALIGVNHYATSDRFLDDRISLYPPALRGGNGQERYVDTEAVRVLTGEGLGWSARLQEVWERYRLPLAATEIHLGDGEAEQIRWLHEAWQAAVALRAQGVDMRAATVWALFGSMDWNSLLTGKAGHYEPGAFDARHSPPRATLLAEAVSALAQTGHFSHALLADEGWWRREDRLHVRVARG